MIGRRPPPRREPRVVVRRGRAGARPRHLLEVPPGDDRIRVVRGDDLALFGELQPAVDGTRRLAEDGPVGRTAAAPDRPATAVEERQLDAARAGRPRRGSPAPGAASRPPPGTRTPCSSPSSRASPPAGRRDAGEMGSIDRVASSASRICPAASSASVVSNSGTTSRTGGSSPVARRASVEDVGHVARGGGEAHDESVARLDPEPRLGRRDRTERGGDLVER